MNFYIKKLFDFLTTLLLVTVVTFVTFNVLPGNPALAILGPDAQEAQIQNMEVQLGLDKPLIVRYSNWIKNALRGDLGISYKYNQKVSLLIYDAIKTTAFLALISLIFTIALGVFFGILFARFRKILLWKSLSTLSQIWISIPSFCTALILILIFSVGLKLLPSVGSSSILSFLLPSLAISLGSSSIFCRYIKVSIENELKQDYVRTARSKGLTENQIIIRHVLKNALIPSITTLGLICADIFGGSIIIENVFSLSGVGKLIINSISSRDFPLLQGLTLYLAAITLICNFTVDILYSIIDPRIRGGKNKI
ncbi:ABC transporter permease [Treponema pectinovorum]|uniref:ABC transporter permease n=1 Tax=Treponema pectinovorum TaxID=164 RepID=UPI003D8E860E